MVVALWRQGALAKRRKMETSWYVKIRAGEVDFDEEMICMEGKWRAYILCGHANKNLWRCPVPLP
jgi:hypothetical protein